ncbi:chromosome condensation regulator RCC1 [Trinickia dabaoshanensis]|uniref:Chromosome condensation regulator RCC1 n=1 Tax=Trinickia dabaoshanensis TaxID=564714 RepID=A0A2N7VQ01_9BURK|nr:polysaccharide pyruvyl transferase family protein [Trinickia dabaoshanensis]PMS19185.1 chromosome condensation regulator RCC1 [Trinickia dabaoshanensis]
MKDATSDTQTETILFGAFDRHNFGDLLFPHVLTRMLPERRLSFAGLAARDLRAFGGHLVEAIGQHATPRRDRPPFDLVHVGGELLTCDAWEAAVMLSPEDRVRAAIDAQPAWLRAPSAWARAALGRSTRAPYVLSKGDFPRARRVLFNAVGGTELAQRDAAMRAEVIAALKLADDVTVRDAITQRALEGEGVAARCVPDPAVMTAELFGDIVREHAACEAVASIRDACQNGYIAVQFSADFGDDRTLDELAQQIDTAAASLGAGVAFFRAGTAPWHDTLEVYERTRQHMRTQPVCLLNSPNVWDICAVLAGSRAYCGSSLHGSIVAAAFAVPHVNVRHPARTSANSKQTAFASTWEDGGAPGEVAVEQIAQGIGAALRIDRARLERTARRLVAEYRAGFERVVALTA